MCKKKGDLSELNGLIELVERMNANAKYNKYVVVELKCGLNIMEKMKAKLNRHKIAWDGKKEK